jgi:hypothetical protein
MPGRARPRPRPDTCPSAVKQSLMDLGHPESWAGPVASDFRMIVPILLKQLGVDEITRRIRDDWKTYQLSDAALNAAVQSVVEWAESELDAFRKQPR